MTGNIQKPGRDRAIDNNNPFSDLISHIATQAHVPYESVFEAMNMKKKDCKIDTEEAMLALSLGQALILGNKDNEFIKQNLRETLALHRAIFSKSPILDIQPLLDILQKYLENSPFPFLGESRDTQYEYEQRKGTRMHEEFDIWDKVYNAYATYFLNAIHTDKTQRNQAIVGDECF